MAINEWEFPYKMYSLFEALDGLGIFSGTGGAFGLDMVQWPLSEHDRKRNRNTI